MRARRARKASLVFFSSLVLTSAFYFAPKVASAATFEYNGFTVTNEQTVHVLTPNDISGGIGQIILHGAGANAGQSIAAWCLDVFDFLANSGTYSTGPLTTAGAGGSNPTLSPTQISEIGSLMVHGTALINTDTNVSAATVLAIWMVEYGKSLSYSDISSTVTALAQSYVANVMPGGQWDCPTCTVTLFSLQGDQNLGSGSVAPVPLPAALPLFAGGLGAVGLLVWRKKKVPASAA